MGHKGYRLFFWLFSLLFSHSLYAQANEEIERIVREYINTCGNDPLYNTNSYVTFLHPDFVSPGSEDLCLSVIDEMVEINTIDKMRGVVNIIHPIEEDYFRVNVLFFEKYFLKNGIIQKTGKKYAIDFYLSKTNPGHQGEYRIIRLKPNPFFTFAFIGELKKELIQTEDSDMKSFYNGILRSLSLLEGETK